MRMSQILCGQTIQKQAEHNERNHHIHPVPFLGERKYRKCNSHHRGSDQYQDSQLNNSNRIERQTRFQNPGNASQLRRLSNERLVVWYRRAMLHEEGNGAAENHYRRNRYPGAQQNSNDRFGALIGHPAPRGVHCANFPTMPLKIISIPRSAITTLNTIRKTLTRAPASSRAPKSDPPSTPSTTGIARAGSM